MLAAAGLLTGAHSDGETVVVDDPMRGLVEIPRSPQRVFTVEGRVDIEPALALGLPVVATGSRRAR